jgi:two-component system, OmpR family, sensor kinase
MASNEVKTGGEPASPKAGSKAGGWSSFAIKSRALFLFLLALGVLPAVYAVVQTRNALDAEEKANGAHNVLGLYIELSEIGHAIEKQRVIGGLGSVEGRSLLARKQATVLQLRQGIAAEIVMRGEDGLAEEGKEFGDLERVNTAIDAMASGAARTNWHQSIDKAIQHEREEMDSIDRDEKVALQSTILVLSISAGVVFFLYMGALYWLDRSIGAPLALLQHATKRVAAGAKNVRLPQMRDAEFDELAMNFNRMAEALEARRSRLEENAAQLEELVSARTTELRAANATLVSVSDNRKQFLTDISHELRTPLAIIRGDAEVTLRGEQKPIDEYRSALQRIAAQISGLTRLVDDLLYVARNDGGAPTMQRRPVDLVRTISQAANSMRLLLEDVEGQLVVTTQLDAAHILGDAQRLTQLVYILLDNAVQYSDGPPNIVVELSATGDGFSLDVRDCGVGIAEADLPTVFDRFRRGKEGIIKNDEGLGIGLPMAKAIIEAHGGIIQIASTLGIGTAVSAFLPHYRNLKVVNEHIGD